jgi:hypothetical protein
MNILKWLRKVTSSVIAGFLSQTSTPGKPRKLSDKDRLVNAAESFRQIYCMVESEDFTPGEKLITMKIIAFDAYGAAK